MELFRLGKCKYAKDLSGEGARIYGGRWNSEGVPAVYFGSSRSLAVLEVLVHLPTDLVPDNFCMAHFEVDVPFKEILLKDLPTNWNDYPFLKQVQLIGNQFFKDNQFLLLKVPSALVEHEYNYIANPLHHDINKLKLIENLNFSFDKRLL